MSAVKKHFKWSGAAAATAGKDCSSTRLFRAVSLAKAGSPSTNSESGFASSGCECMNLNFASLSTPASCVARLGSDLGIS